MSKIGFKVDTLKNDVMEFNIQHCHSSLVNAIRRILLGEIQMLAFGNDITVHENTCNLHNEMILLRLKLIPVMIQDLSFDLESHYFQINVTNLKEEPIYVTSGDITCYMEKKQEDGTKIRQDKPDSWIRKIFPADLSTGDFIPICLLDKGEKIHLTIKLSIGNGRENAQYSPVCKAVFTNVVDKMLAAEALKEKLEKLGKCSSEEIENKKAHFKNYQIERYYQKDEKGLPNNFQFSLESIGIYSPVYLVGESLRIMLKKFRRCRELLEGQGSGLEIEKADCVMDAYDFIFTNEHHTLGNILSNYLTRYFIDIDTPTLTYAAYNCPHPLQKKMKLRISACNNLSDYTETQHRSYIIDHLFKCLSSLTEDLIHVHKKLYKDTKTDEPSLGLRIVD